MFFRKNYALVGVQILLICLIAGCSGNGAVPVYPGETPVLQQGEKDGGSQRVLWGIWGVEYDELSQEIIASPDRNALAHFDITSWLLPPDCDDCFKVVVNSFDPVTRILDADVTLKNPTHLTAYDVRGILFTNEYGHELRNADAWTSLWDIPGGIDINPFMAFAKTEPNRLFAPDTEYTENYLIYIPIPPEWNQITFAVDVSWPGNCREPYGITNFSQDVIYDVQGAGGTLSVDVFDWQGNVSEVTLEIAEISGDGLLPFTNAGGNKWELELINTVPAQEGEYTGRITAISSDASELPLYQYVEITVSEYTSNFNPVDVTPIDFRFSSFKIFIEGDYAYTTGAADVINDLAEGLFILDISDPLNINLVGGIETEASIWSIFVENGYAYLIAHDDAGSFVYVVDVNMPESPVLVKTIEMSSTPIDIDIEGDYAYVARSSGISILDINPPEDTYEAAFFDNPTYYSFRNIEVDGNYAYIALDAYGLGIYNISNPTSPFQEAIIESEGVSGFQALGVLDGYAYLIFSDYGTLFVYDVHQADAPELVNAYENSAHGAIEIVLRDNEAYVAQYPYGLARFDITDPEAVDFLDSVSTEAKLVTGLAVSGDYAFLADLLYGVEVVDISSPGSMEIVNTFRSISFAQDFHLKDNYGFVRGRPFEVSYLFPLDISEPESSYIANHTGPRIGGGSFTIGEGYVYSAGWADMQAGDFSFYDYEPIESFDYQKQIEIPADATSAIASDGGYACVGYSDDFFGLEGLSIIDIDPVEDAYVVTSIDMEYPKDIEMSGGYAYVTAVDSLHVIDIDPPESASIVHSIEYEHPGWGVYRAGNITVRDNHIFNIFHASVYQPLNARDFLGVVNIEDPESAYIMDTLELPTREVRHLKVSGDYAYVTFTGGDDNLLVADISNPDSTFIVDSLHIPEGIGPFDIKDEYMFIASGFDGLRLYKLW